MCAVIESFAGRNWTTITIRRTTIETDKLMAAASYYHQVSIRALVVFRSFSFEIIIAFEMMMMGMTVVTLK